MGYVSSGRVVTIFRGILSQVSENIVGLLYTYWVKGMESEERQKSPNISGT